MAKARGAATANGGGAGGARKLASERTAASAGAASARKVPSVPPVVEEVLGAGTFSVERFVECFDVLVEAAGGLQRLRDMIRTLAFTGKLVKTKSTDTSVGKMLAKIDTAWTQLKRKEVLPDVGEDDAPATPNHWVWVRLGNLAEVVGGVTKGRDLKDRKRLSLPYLRVANVQRGFLDLEEMKEIEIGEDELVKYRLEQGDVLFTEGGDWDKLGRSAIWRCQVEPCIHQNHVFRARFVSRQLDAAWFSAYANSPVGRSYFENAAKRTTNLASINMTQLRACPMPLPPIEEQIRIVARVDQLMALTDELEAKLTRKRELGTRFAKASLEALTNAEGPEEFDAAWKRVQVELPHIVREAGDISRLRNAIVGIACGGWLSASVRKADWGTGTAIVDSIIISRRAQRAKLLRSGVRSGSLPPETRTELAKSAPLGGFPSSWTLCGIDDILDCVPHALKAGPFGSALTKSMYAPRGFKVYGQEQVISGDHRVGNYYVDRAKFESLKSCAIAPGDMLVSLMGTIGRVLILPKDCEPGIINPRLLKVSLHEMVSGDYIRLFLQSPQAQRFLSESARGVAMDGLNIGILRTLPIPLPPLREQLWLLERVAELMKSCEDLEASLRRVEDRASRLVEAILQEMVA